MSKKSDYLRRAISDGNVVQLRNFIESDSALLFGPTNGGATLIHLAVQMGRIEIVQLLLEHGADVNVRDSAGLTPLHWAAEQTESDVAKLLIGAGADISALNHEGEQPLHLAAWQNNPSLASLLLDQGVDIDARAKSNWTPLHYATYYASVEAARILVLRGASLDLRSSDGYTPLHFALSQLPPASSTLLGMLLQGGATLDVYSAIRLGMTCIVRCFLKDDPEMISTDPHAPDFLSAAVRSGRLELVEILLQSGADVNASRHNPLPLWEAICMHNSSAATATAELLLAHGADPNLVRKPNTTSPLEWVKQSKPELLHLFKKHL